MKSKNVKQKNGSLQYDTRRINKPIVPEKNSGISKTMPNMVMSMKEIHERFVRGQGVSELIKIHKEADNFDDGLDIFEALDKAREEMANLQEAVQNMVKKSDMIKAQKEAQAQAEAQAKKEMAKKEKLEKILFKTLGEDV